MEKGALEGFQCIQYPTWDQHVITSFDARDPRVPQDDKHIAFLNGLSYKIQPDGSFLKQNALTN